MRPLTAMGEVHCRTPAQVSVPVNTAAPVSPSTPLRWPLFMYQTMALFEPSVVVVMGAVTAPPSAAHQRTRGAGGLPAGMRTDMTTLPLGPPAGQAALLSVENA